MARSWNGSQDMHPASISNHGNNGRLLLGSLTDRKSDWRSNSMRTTPPLSMHEPVSPQHSHHRHVNRRLDLIGDMVFGTAPLAYKGMSTKVHYKRDKEPQLVLSKLFTFSPHDDVTRRTSFSSINSDWSTTSSTVGVPYGEDYGRRSTSTLSARSVSMDDQSSDDDRSYYSNSSIYPPVLGLRSNSKRSFNSKRSRRFSQTSMENGMFQPMPLPNNNQSMIDPKPSSTPSSAASATAATATATITSHTTASADNTGGAVSLAVLCLQ
jgi:hypothetical protein